MFILKMCMDLDRAASTASEVSVTANDVPTNKKAWASLIQAFQNVCEKLSWLYRKTRSDKYAEI